MSRLKRTLTAMQKQSGVLLFAAALPYGGCTGCMAASVNLAALAGSDTVHAHSKPKTKTKSQAACFAAVGDTLQSWIQQGYYMGCAIVVMHDHQLLYRKYFGNYNAHTVAHIASAGKWLAAATIAALVDKGVLHWSDPVSKWLPQFTDVKGRATLAQLLSHTSGYPDYQSGDRHPDDYQTLKESVQHIVDLPADATPGVHFRYGGLSMQVAGRMAEVATGKDWETLFQQNIAEPLGMTDTHFTPVDTTPGHNPMLGGGARTTLMDYLNFLDMMAHDGSYNGKRILTRKAIRAMEADQVKGASVPPGQLVEMVRERPENNHPDRQVKHRSDIYGLGEWREEVDPKGRAILISSPSWAGAYPWIDKTRGIYGFFLARVSQKSNGFNPFLTSPELAIMVRRLWDMGHRK